MKRYEYAILTGYSWAATKPAQPWVFYFGGGDNPQASPLLIMLNELGAQGWRVVGANPEIHPESGQYLLERELPN